MKYKMRARISSILMAVELMDQDPKCLLPSQKETAEHYIPL